MDTTEFLSSVPLTKGLSKKQIEALAGFTRKKNTEPNNLL